MRFGPTSLRWTGVPLLSCTLVALLPAPAVAVPAPGARALPRAVSSPGPYAGPYGGPHAGPQAAPAEGWGDRLADRLAETFAGHRGHGPHATGLPLPPLFGRHDHRDAARRAEMPEGERMSAERDRRASGDRLTRRTAAGTADGTTGVDRPDARTAPRTDARDGSGGDSSPAPASPAPSASPHDPEPSPAAEQAQPWSPAPVAPQDAGDPVAGGAEPEAQQELPGGTEPGAGVARAAPAAAQAPAGPIVPVLPLGAGLASLGLGLAFLALRLRRG